MTVRPARASHTARPRQTRVETAFTAIRIEGGLFPAEFLQRVAALAAPGQLPEEYAVPPGRSVRDEIGRYWTISEALWKEYRRDRPRTDVDPRRTGIERWLLRFLRDVLGYTDIARTTGPTQIADRRFPVSHRAHGAATPLLLTLADYDLDRSHPSFGDEGRRRAPYAAMQEYLNAEPAARWGIVANGPRLRLLRDNPSLTRPAFVEADLERIFEEGLYPDFVALWLIAHASRTTPAASDTSGCWLERWRIEGAKTGQRALERLRAGVTSALRELGAGFVEHPDNGEMRAALDTGALTADRLHQQLLRLVYRLLFLFTAEERDLLHPPVTTAEARVLYASGYSLTRLRDRARLKRHYDRHADLWSGLSVTFRALARGAPPLGLPALGGLFDPDQCPVLDSAKLSNSRLLAAIHALAFFAADGNLHRVNYRDMGTEELGSVYESLLELHPVVQVATRPWSFSFVGDDGGGSAKGHERKLSGSYYTPDSLVQELLRSALDPVIEQTLRDNPTDPRGALLRLKVLDPACGSGHFLLGAARRLADALARLDAEGEVPDEVLRRHALREVVRRCLFGVDRNPLSVELCRAALWIEAIEPGKPLTFLDAHIRCGDSLIGVTDLTVLRAGIPDEAFKPLTGDDKSYASDLRKRNKAERENPSFTLLPEVALPPSLATAIAALTEAPEDSLDDVAAKRTRLRDVQQGRAGWDLRVACDLWCAAFFAPKAIRPELRGRELVPTTDTVWRYLQAPSSVYGPLIGAVEELRWRLRFFHWPLEFPDAWAAGGFDCVLGNPPWERIKLQEQEFFGPRHAAIATAPNAAQRRRLIAELANGDPADREMYRAFEYAKRDAEAAGQFVRGGARFPLTAVGDVNTYALFAEHVLDLRTPRGQAGVIVPTGIATDDSTKAFFEAVMSGGRLVSLYDFENREGLFPEVDSRMKFALLTLGHGVTAARFVFFATRVEHLSDTRRAFTLSAEDIRLLNPNTRTCPVFRSSEDAELTKRIYRRLPVLVEKRTDGPSSAWNVRLRTMFHKTNDDEILEKREELIQAGVTVEGLFAITDSGDQRLAVYEGEFGWQFDHRYATVIDGSIQEATIAWKADPSHSISTERYVRPRLFREKIARYSLGSQVAFLGFRRVASSTNERTSVATLLPFFPSTYGWIIATGPETRNLGILCGVFNSFCFDYLLRNALSQPSIPQGTYEQIAVPSPSNFDERLTTFLIPRILELTYTAHDMRPWAEELGYTGPPFVWDEDHRAHLRAELDAAYAYLYGLTRDELRYILDPADVYGPDFPSETFRVLKEKEIRTYGEYRTARLVLDAWDRFTADGTFQDWNTPR